MHFIVDWPRNPKAVLGFYSAKQFLSYCSKPYFDSLIDNLKFAELTKILTPFLVSWRICYQMHVSIFKKGLII